MNASILVAALVMAVLAPAAWGADSLLRVSTPDYLLPLTQKLAATYAKDHPEFKAEPSAAAGTLKVFEELSDKHATLAITPRAIKFKEGQACETALGRKPLDFKLGVNGVAVYVAKENAVQVLTYDELEGIFTGRIKNWKDVGGNDAPIELIRPEPNTAAGELFKDEVLGGKEVGSDALRTADAGIADVVAKKPNAIGFGRLTSTDGARTVAIKRAPSSTPVSPSEESISSRTYPISRYLYGYLSPAADSTDVKAFLDWVRSDDGQRVVKDAGYFVLPPKLRVSK